MQQRGQQYLYERCHSFYRSRTVKQLFFKAGMIVFIEEGKSAGLRKKRKNGMSKDEWVARKNKNRSMLEIGSRISSGKRLSCTWLSLLKGRTEIFPRSKILLVYSLVDSFWYTHPSTSVLITDLASLLVFYASICRTNTTLAFLQMMTLFIDRIGIQQCCRTS